MSCSQQAGSTYKCILPPLYGKVVTIKFTLIIYGWCTLPRLLHTYDHLAHCHLHKEEWACADTYIRGGVATIGWTAT